MGSQRTARRKESATDFLSFEGASGTPVPYVRLKQLDREGNHQLWLGARRLEH